MSEFGGLTEMEQSVLAEIGNIGGGNAATALSDMLADKVDMSVPGLSIVDVSTMATILGGPENEVAGILLSMTDDVSGMLMFLLEKDFACFLINALLDENINSFENLTEMHLSAMKEIGNILAGAYVNAIASMTNMTISLTTPQISVDMVGAILSYPAALFGSMGDSLLMIEENFSSGEQSVKSHLLIMPDEVSVDKIMKALDVRE